MIDFCCDDCGYIDCGPVYGSPDDFDKIVVCVDGIETTIS